MIKVHARYTVDCDYFFSEDEVRNYIKEMDWVDQTPDEVIRQWVSEDFSVIECTVMDVLPNNYHADLEVQTNI